MGSMKLYLICFFIGASLISILISINYAYVYKATTTTTNNNWDNTITIPKTLGLPEAKEASMETLIFNVAGEEGVNPGIAKRIAFAESSFNPLAEPPPNTNGSTDKGLFQINSIHGVPDSCRLDALCNTRWALRKMAREGFGAWKYSEHNWGRKDIEIEIIK